MSCSKKRSPRESRSKAAFRFSIQDSSLCPLWLKFRIVRKEGGIMKKIFFLTALSVVLMSGQAIANQGFYLGAGFVHNNPVGADVDHLNSATGIALRLGYDFGPVSLESSLLGSTHDDERAGIKETEFGGITIDFKIPLTPSDKRNQVYVLAGFGGYSLTYNDPVIGEVKYGGGGMNLGVGTEHYFNKHLAFNLSAVYRSIKYDEREAQGATTEISPKIEGDTVAIEAGLNYHF